MRQRLSNMAAVRPDMTPMIDCVFQLMIFFMLTLKIVAAEGEFEINLPQHLPAGTTVCFDAKLQVRLTADESGHLAGIQLGYRKLGNDEQAFARLNSEILRAVGALRGSDPLSEPEIEIDADANLQSSYVIKAISAFSGRFDERTQTAVRYVEKITFAPVRRNGDQ